MWRSIIEQNLRDCEIEPTESRIIKMLEMLLNQSRREADYYRKGCSKAYLMGFPNQGPPASPVFGVPHDAARDEK